VTDDLGRRPGFAVPPCVQDFELRFFTPGEDLSATRAARRSPQVLKSSLEDHLVLALQEAHDAKLAPVLLKCALYQNVRPTLLVPNLPIRGQARVWAAHTTEETGEGPKEYAEGVLLGRVDSWLASCSQQPVVHNVGS
jgi:hypothetical protein